VHDSTNSHFWRPTDGKETEPITSKVVRITCSVNYQDQNWGNNKGKVKLALMREGTEIAGENLFSEGAPRPYATRERILTHESVVEQAEPGDTFSLFHIVGG
jgi:hypothetical protein